MIARCNARHIHAMTAVLERYWVKLHSDIEVLLCFVEGTLSTVLTDDRVQKPDFYTYAKPISPNQTDEGLPLCSSLVALPPHRLQTQLLVDHAGNLDCPVAWYGMFESFDSCSVAHRVFELADCGYNPVVGRAEEA